MRVHIIGGAGMVGRKLAERLASDGRLGSREISQLHLYDVVPAEKPAGARFPVEISTGDLSQASESTRLVADRPESALSGSQATFTCSKRADSAS